MNKPIGLNESFFSIYTERESDSLDIIDFLWQSHDTRKRNSGDNAEIKNVFMAPEDRWAPTKPPYLME